MQLQNTFSPNNSITVAGFTMANSANFKILSGYGSNGLAYATGRANGASAGYQVPAGKTFVVLAIRFRNVGSPAIGMTFGYGDTDCGIANGAGPTNQVYYAGFGWPKVAAYFPAGSQTPIEIAVNFTIPALKYPFTQCDNAAGSTGHVEIFGYEV